MKRLTMLIVAGIMGLLLIGCGENAPKPAPTTDTSATQPAAGTTSDTGTSDNAKDE